MNEKHSHSEQNPIQIIVPNSLLCGNPLSLLKQIQPQSVTLVLTYPPLVPAMILNVSVSLGGELLSELKRIVKPGGTIITIAPTKQKITEQNIEHILDAYSKPQDTVLDFNMGQGLIIATCQKLKRKFIGIEKDKDLFEKACKKLKQAKKPHKKSQKIKKPEAASPTPMAPEISDTFEQIDMFD